MALKWTLCKGGLSGTDLELVAELLSIDEPVEHEARETKSTDWRLYCNRHWDTGAPDEWIVLHANMTRTAPFPTKTEAMAYAEVTYALGESSGLQ